MKRYAGIMAVGILALAQALGLGTATQSAVQHALVAQARVTSAHLAVGPIDGGPNR